MDLVVRNIQFAEKTQAYDITVAAPFAINYRREASKSAGAAANLAETPKLTYYHEMVTEEGMDLYPIGVNSYGALGSNARKAFRHIGCYAAEVRGTNPANEIEALTTRFVSHLYRLQALAINRRRITLDNSDRGAS